MEEDRHGNHIDRYLLPRMRQHECAPSKHSECQSHICMPLAMYSGFSGISIHRCAVHSWLALPRQARYGTLWA